MGDRGVQFDFDISFSNGGGIQGQGFRLDIEGSTIEDSELGEYIVRDMRLLMVDRVSITNKRYIDEPHKRGGRSDLLIDLSHTITDGLVTYPGLPAPVIGTHLSRETAEQVYGPHITFHIGLVTMCTNTGTYLDVPFHRFADGHDLSALDLRVVAGVPAVCLDHRGERSIELGPGELHGVAGHAVLIRTDHSILFGTEAYAHDHPHLSGRSARMLVDASVACVGIDSLNIDSTTDMSRPVHTTLLAAQIPIAEHLTNLSALPAHGFRFTAVPPKIEGAGTFTVRAFATILG